MNESQIREAWAKILAGQRLPLQEEEELLRELESNDALRAEFVHDAQTHGSLRLLDRMEGDAEAFKRGVLRSIVARDDGTGFVKKIGERILEGGEAAQATPPRRRTRRRRAGSGGFNPTVWALAAAGVLFAILLAVAISRPSRGRTDDKTARSADVPMPVPGAPDAPKPPEDDAAARSYREAQERLRKIEEERAKLAQTPPPADDPQAIERRKAELAAEKERIEREMRAAVAHARQGKDTAPKAPETPPSPERLPAQPRPDTTLAEVAKVGHAEHATVVMADGAKVPARAGQGVLAGQGLEVLAGGSARLEYPDGTKVDVGAETELRELKAQGGKRVFVARGTVRAVVAKQPQSQQMVFATPDMNSTVLGTTLRILVDPDPKKGTTLAVEEGKVQLKNLAGKTVLVESGHYTVAAVGVELAKKSLFLFRDTFESGASTQWRLPANHPWRIEADPDGKGRVLTGGTWPGGLLKDRVPFAPQSGDATWTDYAVEVSIRFQKSNVPGLRGGILYARMQNAQNYYFLEWVGESEFFMQIYREGGTGGGGFATNNRVPAPQPGRWYRLRFELEGTALRGYLDGKLLVEAQDANFKSGGVGLSVSDVSRAAHDVLWDDVRVERLPSDRK